MTWILLTLSCIILWGVTDILYKVSLDHNDPISHYKTFIWIGIAMALVGCIMSTWSNTLPDTIKTVREDLLYLVPLCIVYASALFFGLFGKKHLYASVISVLENIDGAIAAIIIYFYYLLTGFIHPSYQIDPLSIIASVSIIIGIILLGSQEQALLKQEAHLHEDEKKHRFGALALFFPIIYSLADLFLIAELNGIASANITIPAIDFFILQCVGFVVVSICIWFYLLIAKKYVYNPFDEGEVVRCGAAIGETFGTMTFILAAELNPVLTSPISSSYCLVTIVLARVFLKERLTKKHYLSLAFLLAGIALLSVCETIKG